VPTDAKLCFESNPVNLNFCRVFVAANRNHRIPNSKVFESFVAQLSRRTREYLRLNPDFESPKSDRSLWVYFEGQKRPNPDVICSDVEIKLPPEMKKLRIFCTCSKWPCVSHIRLYVATPFAAAVIFSLVNALFCLNKKFFFSISRQKKSFLIFVNIIFAAFLPLPTD
jgi:hypothetical protein